MVSSENSQEAKEVVWENIWEEEVSQGLRLERLG